MKKLLLFFTIITSLHFPSVAQFLNLRYGPEIGVGISTLNIAVTSGTSQQATAVSGKTTKQFGIVADKSFSEHFSIQPALLYVGKGASGTSINYLEVPVNLVYTKGEGHGVFVSIGPYIGYAIGGTGVNIGKASDTTSTNLGIKSIDYGVQAGLGWQLRNGLIFKFNFDMGLSDLNFKTTDQKITTGTFMFTIGWLLWGQSMYDL